MELKFVNDLLKNKRLDKFTLFIIVALIVVFLNLVCARIFVRLDLTGDRIYSLSSSSKKVVRELHEPMTVKVFFTRDLPAPYSTYYKYLEDLLREYRSSGWKFRYEFVDLKRKPTAPDEYGIQPVQLQVYEKDQVQFKRAHIGMVFIHGDVIERIPQITSTEGLEYKITSIIRKMNNKVDKLARLKGNVEVVLFASSNIPLPDIQSVEGKVKEKFESLNKKYLGKLKFSSVDTARNPESEKVAREYGMRAVSWPSMRGAPAGSGYIGVVVVFGDKREGMNLLGQNMFGQYFIDGVDTIDTSLSGVIDNLIGLNRKIGYVTGYGEPNRFGGYGGMMGRGGDDQNTISHLAGFVDAEYQFESVAVKDKKIPADVSALLVIGPKQKLDDYALFQIDQFVMSGKPVAFVLSGLDFPQPPPELAMYQQQPPQGSAVNTGLEYLLAAYGVKLNNNVVFDENCYKQRTPPEYGGGERAIYFAPIIEQDNISQKHPITQKIKGMVALQASSIEPIDSVIKANKLSYLELIKTSKRSWQQGEGAMLQYAMPPQGTNDYKKFTISAVVEGPAKSYFDGKPIPRGATNASTAAGIGLAATNDVGFMPSAKKARVFILAGGEMAKNSIVDQEGKYPNSVFMKNVIDWLAADQDLIPIRKKGLSYNPMKKVPDFVKTLIKFINVGGVPLIVIALGIFLWRLDNARRERIRAQFK